MGQFFGHDYRNPNARQGPNGITSTFPIARLDPSGYRADLIFRLADQLYQLPNLYDLLLEHYSVIKATDALGKT